MKVVDEALQLFGGAGTSREYPIERLFRDTRAALIEDGENYVLTMRLGPARAALYAEGWAQTDRRRRFDNHSINAIPGETYEWPSIPSSSMAPAATPAC